MENWRWHLRKQYCPTISLQMLRNILKILSQEELISGAGFKPETSRIGSRSANFFIVTFCSRISIALEETADNEF
jgi:hypothetical protein